MCFPKARRLKSSLLRGKMNHQVEADKRGMSTDNGKRYKSGLYFIQSNKKNRFLCIDNFRTHFLIEKKNISMTHSNAFDI